MWTLENSNKINLLFAVGASIADAAAALGITQPTLRKHYFSEVEQWRVARLRLKASLLAKLHAEAAKGNVGAVKEIFRQLDKGELEALAASAAGRRAPRGSKPPAPKPEPLGKKRELEQAAGLVEGIYAPPAAPPSTRH